MYTNFIAYAYNAGYEFVTTEDLASRIAAEQAATLSETTSGNVITATVTPSATEPDLGAMALNVVNGAAGQVIRTPAAGMPMTLKRVHADELPKKLRRRPSRSRSGRRRTTSRTSTTLPMRADLQSVTGNGSNLTFSFTGDGTVDIHLKTPGANIISV